MAHDTSSSATDIGGGEDDVVSVSVSAAGGEQGRRRPKATEAQQAPGRPLWAGSSLTDKWCRFGSSRPGGSSRGHGRPEQDGVEEGEHGQA